MPSAEPPGSIPRTRRENVHGPLRSRLRLQSFAALPSPRDIGSIPLSRESAYMTRRTEFQRLTSVCRRRYGCRATGRGECSAKHSTRTPPDRRRPRRGRGAGRAHRPRCARAIGRVIFGQDEVVDQTLITLLSGGHVLLVGVPGLGKSRLVETLGTVLGLATKRVQFTPDLMPADIIGSEVLDESRRPAQLPLRARPGVLPVADGRRDQPRQPAHPVGAAAGDAGAARRGRRRRARAAAPVPCAGDAEPDRAGRHLSAARRRSSTGSCWRSTSATRTCDAERTMLLATTGAAEARADPALTAEELLAAQALIRRVPVGETRGGGDPERWCAAAGRKPPTTTRCAAMSPGVPARAPRRR